MGKYIGEPKYDTEMSKDRVTDKVKVKVIRLKFNCRNLNLFLCSYLF